MDWREDIEQRPHRIHIKEEAAPYVQEGQQCHDKKDNETSDECGVRGSSVVSFVHVEFPRPE